MLEMHKHVIDPTNNKGRRNYAIDPTNNKGRRVTNEQERTTNKIMMGRGDT